MKSSTQSLIILDMGAKNRKKNPGLQALVMQMGMGLFMIGFGLLIEWRGTMKGAGFGLVLLVAPGVGLCLAHALKPIPFRQSYQYGIACFVLALVLALAAMELKGLWGSIGFLWPAVFLEPFLIGLLAVLFSYLEGSPAKGTVRVK